jgi:MFS family permease
MRLHYGWVIVAAGAVMGCVAVGTTFSLAVFLQPMSVATGWSRTGVSSAMTIVFLAMGIGGFAWGALTDRFGPLPVVLTGGLLLGLGLALASRATSLLEFQLVYGIMVGGSAGAIFAPLIATVTGWFDKHRSLAVSLVSAGMGVCADDDLSVRELADHDLRLAHRAVRNRDPRLGADRADRISHSPAADGGNS